MNFDEYQKLAAETAIYPKAHGLVYTVLGLASEAGEVSGVLKKVLRDNRSRWTPEKLAALDKELGDVLWYIAMCAKEANLTLSGIAQRNLKKLAARKAAGTLKGSGGNR